MTFMPRCFLRFSAHIETAFERRLFKQKLSTANMKNFLIQGCFYVLVLFLTAGCRALPERNYIGMTRAQVIDAVAETPKVRTGKHSEFHVSVSLAANDHGAYTNLYFETLDELRKDKCICDAKLLGIYYQSHWSGFTFYYELAFQDDIVVCQRLSAYSDGITALPIWVFCDYPGEKKFCK